MIESARRILNERLALHALEYQVPRVTLSVKYMLGGLTAFLLLVLIVTGLYLSQYYNPTVTGAHDSVLYLISRAPLGDWIRTLHFLSAGGVVLTVTAHLCYTFWRRAYQKPREVTWWAGVVMAAIIFLLIVTGTALRYDQEGFEALAHFVAGGNLTGAFGRFFTDSFTPSTSLLSRIFGLHTSLLPLVLIALIALHFWLIRHLGIHTDPGDGAGGGVGGAETGVFRTHTTRLAGFSLVFFAVLGVLAVLVPEGIGYPGVAGVEITKAVLACTLGLRPRKSVRRLGDDPWSRCYLSLLDGGASARSWGGPDARQTWLGGLAGGCAGNPNRRTVGIRCVRGGPGTYRDVTPIGMRRRLGCSVGWGVALGGMKRRLGCGAGWGVA